jgi:hypothetical protein
MFGRSQTQEHLKSVGKKYTTKENIEKLMWLKKKQRNLLLQNNYLVSQEFTKLSSMKKHQRKTILLLYKGQK